MIGIFIGSFNPPTKAHLEITCNLEKRYEKIIFVPVNSREKELVSIKDRINMLNILKKKYSFLEVEDIMKDYSYLNFRIIDLLKKKYQKIEIIIGSDLLEKLVFFENYQYLLSNYSFMVITRGQINVLKIIKEKYLPYENHFQILNYESSISSGIVREKIMNNEDIKDYLDEDVYDYIKNKHLYF